MSGMSTRSSPVRVRQGGPGRAISPQLLPRADPPGAKGRQASPGPGYGALVLSSGNDVSQFFPDKVEDFPCQMNARRSIP